MADAGPSLSPDTGPSSRVRGFMQAALRYFEVRGKLAQLEAQEAGAHITKVSVRLVLALGALFLSWLLAMPAIVVLTAELLKQRWAWVRWEYVALAFAALHVILGVIMFTAAARRWRQARLFEESLNQLSKDREWLAHNQQPLI